jgi:hypothetical protein
MIHMTSQRGISSISVISVKTETSETVECNREMVQT